MDIVERLRNCEEASMGGEGIFTLNYKILTEAANEIELLRERLMIADDVYDQAVEICKNEIKQLREEIKYLNDEKDNLEANHQLLEQELNYQEDMYANLLEEYDALKQKDTE